MAHSDRLRDHEAEQRIFQSRALLAGVIVAVLFAGVLTRLVFLQYIDHGHYSTLSDDNRIRLQAIPPTRGLIRDREGRILAENLPSYSLQLVPERVDDLEATIERLGALIELDARDIERVREKWHYARPFEGVPLRLRLSPGEVARLSVDLHRFPGADVVAGLTRHYPHGETASHVIGYVGRLAQADLERLDAARYRGTNHVGKVGAEFQYEDLLHGEPGVRQVEVNVRGRVLRVIDEQAPTPGRDLHLTLDLDLQRVAEEALGEQAGAAVALDPATGEVLALASTPGFDPNLFAQGISSKVYRALREAPRRPLFNRALRGQYAPGSTVKPIVALHALEHEIRDPDETIHCRGYYRLPGGTRRYGDWKVHGHLDLGEAITQSCNVMFYELARQIGIDDLARTYRAFGLGSRSGIDLPGERTGLVPDEAWKRSNYGEPWYRGETIIHGIGQGFMTVTPVQLANTAAMLANRGDPVRPHVFLRSDDDGPSPVRAELAELEAFEMSDESDWEYVIDAMVGVTRGEQGTARSLRWRSPNVIAGKTGTAQVYSRPTGAEAVEHEDRLYELRNHGLFIGFAPPHRPRIAVGVLVEHGGGGSAVAAPVAQQVIDAWLEKTAAGVPASNGMLESIEDG